MAIQTEQQAIQHLLKSIAAVKGGSSTSNPVRYRGPEDPVARFLGIEVVEQAIQGREEGLYIPGGSPKIVLDLEKFVHPDRVNFTFFHEISHHLIRTDDELYSFFHDGFFVGSPQPTVDARFIRIIEHYCNIGAAEFLIPAEEVKNKITEQGFSIRLVEDLDTTHRCTPIPVAIQLARCAAHECLVVICENALPEPHTLDGQLLPEDQAGPMEPRLEVKYSISSPTFKYKSARGVSVPGNHLISRVFRTQGYERGKAKFIFRSRTQWEEECEAFFYRGRVYAVFNETLPTPSEQIPLGI